MQRCQSLLVELPEMPGGGGGGALNLFSSRGVLSGFLKCGACELLFASEKGGGALN